MQRVILQNYIQLGMDLQAASAIFGLIENPESTGALGAMLPHKTVIEELSEEEKTGLKQTLQRMHDLCQGFGLSVSRRMLKRALSDPPETQREFKMLRQTVLSEMKGTVFLFVPTHLADYYEWDGIVTDRVIKAFPKAYEEIRNAGTCLAAGLATACVFHAMRAAEIGLRALGTDLRIELKNNKQIEMADWQEILNAVTPKIRDIENKPHDHPNKDADLLFYNEAWAQFRFFKNGWRIRVAHARATYDEPQAKEALDHVRSFFEAISPRLKE